MLTRSTTRNNAPTLALAFTLSLTACGAGTPHATGTWAGTIDTLANGALHIQNPATGLWDEATAWQVEEELRIGTMDGAGPDLFGELTDIAIDGNGRIYVLDGQASEVRVFDPEGHHLRTFGRSGSGPGEFKNPVALRWDEAGRLWVVDPGNARYSIFDITGAYQTMVRRTSGYVHVPWPGGFDAAGRLYDVANVAGPNANAWTVGLIAFQVDSQDPVPADTFQIPDYEGDTFVALNRQGQRSMSIPVPFAPRLVWHFEPRGALWAAVTGRYRIARINAAGDTTRIVERASRPAPVTTADREEAIANLEWFTAQGGKIDPARIPATKPAIRSFFTDPDGYLWVQPVTTMEDHGYLVDLFDPDGRYLGELRLPFGLGYFPPLIIGDQLYAITQDELEVQYVVRARIVGKGRGER
jgi:sugar lactone lactonase YvrE